MIKLFDCTKEVVKEHVNRELTQSPFIYWKGWIGAIKKGNLFRVYHYVNFPYKTYDLHYYLRKVK